MSKYGQYCPVAQALDILGERWTLLIIRDMLTGTVHFNALQRGLPGLSRGLLAKRLRQLELAGLIKKQTSAAGRHTTAYYLTAAGQALYPVIESLLNWGATWAFGDPSPEELDPLLLMWWMRNRVYLEHLPDERVVVQYDFYGAETCTYWLMLTRSDVSVCLTDPGYDLTLLVTADLATFFKLWLGRIGYDEAIDAYGVRVDGLPRYVRAFPSWFTWSPAAAAVRAARAAAT